jgi:shikimate kinase
MGCGKSTVGRALADLLVRDVADLDLLIAEREGQAISAIFRDRGEVYFRRVESAMLAEVARRPRPAVVALGGGTFVGRANRSTIARTGRSIWIDVPLRVLVRRVPRDGTRPLARDPDRFRRLLRARTRFYRTADVRVRAGGLGPERIARAIVRALAVDTGRPSRKMVRGYGRLLL